MSNNNHDIVNLSDDEQQQVETRKRKNLDDSDNSIIFSLDFSEDTSQNEPRKFINLDESPDIILCMDSSKMAPNMRLAAEADELKQLLSWEPIDVPSTSKKSPPRRKTPKKSKQKRESIDELMEELEEGLPQTSSKDWKQDAESMMSNFAETIAQAERENWGVVVADNNNSGSSDGGGEDDEENSKKTTSKKGKSETIKEPAKKKRKRTKEEIEQEKFVKEINKLKREHKASKNSKCEKYLFCHFNNSILALNEELEKELKLIFEEREIKDQLIIEEDDSINAMRVVWRRKRIDAFIEDGKLNTIRTMELEGNFISVLNGDSFTELVKSKKIFDYLKEQFEAVKKQNMPDPQLTVFILGKIGLRDAMLHSTIFEVFERLRVQFRFSQYAKDLSLFIAQTHRALAKLEKRLENEKNNENLPVINSNEKGISRGEHLVRDWWSRMLERMHRLREDQKRALIDRHPCPFKLMDELLELPAGEAMYQLADIETEDPNGRRIGAVIAQKIYAMLTSRRGDEILHVG